MDFSWINVFLAFLLFCLLFMAIMAMVCLRTGFRCGPESCCRVSPRVRPPDPQAKPPLIQTDLSAKE